VRLAEGVGGAVHCVDGRRDDERGRLRDVPVVLRWLSPSQAVVGRRLLAGPSDCRREVTDSAVVLIGDEPARDVDPVKQPPTGGELCERGRRVAVDVRPDGRVVVDEQVIKDERLQDRHAAIAIGLQQHDILRQ
jgi:hypothetical protein